MPLPQITEWTEEEAAQNFKRIKESPHSGEWYNIEWKEKLNFEGTGTRVGGQNTTQKAISGFANTYGGTLIIGISDDGTVTECPVLPNVENHLSEKLNQKLKPVIPFFKAKYYQYGEKKLLVIYVAASKTPMQCDNGVYYYREQSAFIQMPHNLLERKFRKNFEDEKYLYLVKMDLNNLVKYLGMKIEDVSNNPSSEPWPDTVSYRLRHFTVNLQKSGSKLYNTYKEKDMLGDFSSLMELLQIWIAGERDVSRNGPEFNTLKQKCLEFLQKLET